MTIQYKHAVSKEIYFISRRNGVSGQWSFEQS